MLSTKKMLKTDQEHIRQISTMAKGEKVGLCVMALDCLLSINESLLVSEISINTFQINQQRNYLFHSAPIRLQNQV